MDCRDIIVEENVLSGCIIYLLKKQTLVDFLFFVLYFYCSFNYQSFFFNYYLFLTIARKKKKKTSKLWIYTDGWQKLCSHQSRECLENNMCQLGNSQI